MREGGRIKLTTPTCQMTMMLVIEGMFSAIRTRVGTNGSNSKTSIVVLFITTTKANGCSKTFFVKKKEEIYCKKHKVNF